MSDLAAPSGPPPRPGAGGREAPPKRRVSFLLIVLACAVLQVVAIAAGLAYWVYEDVGSFHAATGFGVRLVLNIVDLLPG